MFLQIGFPGPHPPYDPIPRYAERYLRKELPLLEVSSEELAGAAPGAMEAHSALPALEGADWSGPAHVFAEQAGDNVLTGCVFMTMVCSRTWKLVHFLDESYGQIFDLSRDPDEVRNLWDDAGAAPKKEELLAVLREWRVGGPVGAGRPGPRRKGERDETEHQSAGSSSDRFE